MSERADAPRWAVTPSSLPEGPGECDAGCTESRTGSLPALWLPYQLLSALSLGVNDTLSGSFRFPGHTVRTSRLSRRTSAPGLQRWMLLFPPFHPCCHRHFLCGYIPCPALYPRRALLSPQVPSYGLVTLWAFLTLHLPHCTYEWL